jgi:CTD kinase subunit gamma
MDSFEVNTQFIQLLRTINPTVQSLKKTSHFALKNSENEDYLFQSILEILEDPVVEINTKSTIFQFIDVLINESSAISQQPKSTYSYPYVTNLKNLLPSILLKVLPNSSNYNLYNVFNSLKSISTSLNIDYLAHEKRYLTVDKEPFSPELVERLNANEPYPEVKITDSSVSDSIIKTWDLLIMKRRQSHYERVRLLKHQVPTDKDVEENDMFHLKPKEKVDPNELSKRQILARMEDDRETHKRSKESLWVVNRPKNSNYATEAEFYEYYWSKYDVLTGDDEKALMQSLDDFNNVVLGSYKDNQL